MPSRQTPAPIPGYEQFLGELKQRIRSAQLRAGIAVNRELVLLYWSIGRDILERQRIGALLRGHRSEDRVLSVSVRKTALRRYSKDTCAPACVMFPTQCKID
jgi:hypothetical protein